jgi:hypothetical protein
MHLEKQGNHRDTDRLAGRRRKKFFDAGLDEGVYALFEGLARGGVAKDDFRETPALVFRNQFVYNVIGVENLDADVFQVLRQQAFAAGDAPCQGDAFHSSSAGAAFTSASLGS